jgi:hypothetical protein
MARQNERYSWRDDWKDDGEDRQLSSRPMSTEASLEEYVNSPSDTASNIRGQCGDLFRKDNELEDEKIEIAQNRVILFRVNANPKEYLN